MDTSVAFLLITVAFVVCVFLGALVVFALRQNKSSRRHGVNLTDGVYPGTWDGVQPGTWDGSSTAGHASQDGLPHSNPHHHHHHHDVPQHHHHHHDAPQPQPDTSHHGSASYDGGASHGGGGHSGGFDGGGHSGGFDGGGGFGGGHH